MDARSFALTVGFAMGRGAHRAAGGARLGAVSTRDRASSRALAS